MGTKTIGHTFAHKTRDAMVAAIGARQDTTNGLLTDVSLSSSSECEAVTGISVKKPTALKPSAIEYAPCASRRPAHSACSSVVLRELPLSPHARVRHGTQARAGC